MKWNNRKHWVRWDSLMIHKKKSTYFDNIVNILLCSFVEWGEGHMKDSAQSDYMIGWKRIFTQAIRHGPQNNGTSMTRYWRHTRERYLWVMVCPSNLPSSSEQVCTLLGSSWLHTTIVQWIPFSFCCLAWCKSWVSYGVEWGEGKGRREELRL